MPEARSTFLFLTDGTADKIYNAHLEERPDGWAVTFENGRRGKALRSGEKVSGLDFEAAEKAFEKLVRSKMAKGYTEDPTGRPFSGTQEADRVTGYKPQLFNEISDIEARTLGPDWLVQEKHDGERRGILWDGERAIFSNRRGLEVSVDPSIQAAIEQMGRIVGAPLELDAEDMGSHVVVFDVLQHFMMKEGSFGERAAILAHLHKTIDHNGLIGPLQVDIPTPADVFFAEHADRLREGGAEGCVVRHVDSRIQPGRPASGGDALKVKWWAEATCRVAPGRDGKASIGLELQDGIDGPWVAVGNVGVPAGMAVPDPGALVEVRYLHAMPGGALIQPVLKALRTDVTEEAAQMVQLKVRPASPEKVGPEGPEDAAPEP